MIYYASRTGNVISIIERTRLPSKDISKFVGLVEEYFILFTYTDLLGEVPKLVKDFMNYNNLFCKGIVCSGNSNFGKNNFCAAADKLSEMYNIPIIEKYDLRGNEKQDLKIIDFYNKEIL